MEPSFDLPDATDWLSTPLALLTPLETALRCQVCKDFFDNPVITSCSHTFCSLCIRRCLSTEGKCPACRSADQELKLRRNWAVQELVDAFSAARPHVLNLATEAAAGPKGKGETGCVDEEEAPASKKRKVDGEENGNATGAGVAEGRQTRSRSKGVTAQTPREPAVEVIEDSQDEDGVPDGLAECPICSRTMKVEAVYNHLDVCDGNPAPTPAPAPPKQTSFGSLQMPSYKDTKKPPERLPTINYSLLKDNVLRKKLKDLGIPNSGSRTLLQKRHTEFMNLWNANCDSKTPKSKRELLQELDIWERTQGAGTSTESANGIMRKDFDAAAWSTSHNTDFKQLIANARKKPSGALDRPPVPQPPTVPQPSASEVLGEIPAAPYQPTETLASTETSQKPVEAVDLTATNVIPPDA